MSTQTTLGEAAKPEIDGKQRERDVVFTANGSAKASREIWRTGALVGLESMNQLPPQDVPVEFVDWPFSKLRERDEPDLGEVFDHHLKVVRGARPRYAVAPDVNAYTNFEDAVAWGDELRRYAETVIMVPKAVLPTDVPRRFRVGMPCQERFGPTPWKWPQYRECEEVHLLGGSPAKHREILKYYVPVESVDTTSPLMAARFGSYWNGTGWSEVDGEDQFYYCLKRSYSNMRFSLNPKRRVWDPRPRNQHHDYETAFKELDDTGLFDHEEDLPRPPREAYYVCDSPRELAEWVYGQIRGRTYHSAP